uniref:Uncharacterized protein n=1 Tax=Fervidicoccus fontis TaxID=683846 RepID=A0A7J3ZJ65_9CREN
MTELRGVGGRVAWRSPIRDARGNISYMEFLNRIDSPKVDVAEVTCMLPALLSPVPLDQEGNLLMLLSGEVGREITQVPVLVEPGEEEHSTSLPVSIALRLLEEGKVAAVRVGGETLEGSRAKHVLRELKDILMHADETKMLRLKMYMMCTGLEALVIQERTYREIAYGES